MSYYTLATQHKPFSKEEQFKVYKPIGEVKQLLQEHALEFNQTGFTALEGLGYGKLIRRARKAIDTLIFHNMRMVIEQAERYSDRKNLDQGDLHQEGVRAIIHAIKKFDATKNTKFSSYAYFWIRAYMTDFEKKSKIIKSCIKNGVKMEPQTFSATTSDEEDVWGDVEAEEPERSLLDNPLNSLSDEEYRLVQVWAGGEGAFNAKGSRKAESTLKKEFGDDFRERAEEIIARLRSQFGSKFSFESL